MNDIYKNLSKCVTVEEVWQLMEGQIYANSNNSKFEDSVIELLDSRRKFKKIELPKNKIGLAMRLILFLRLKGYLRKAPVGGGAVHYAKLLKNTIGDLLKIKYVVNPKEVSTNMLDELIEQYSTSLELQSVSNKIYRMKEWHTLNELLPYFLRLNDNLFDESKEYPLLLEKQNGANTDNRLIGGTREPYPLDKVKVIVAEAIGYIEKYSDDCVLAARLYKKFEHNRGDKSATVSTTMATKYMLSGEHVFNEPSLKKIQDYCKTLKRKSYKSNPNRRGESPKGAMSNAATKLQEASIIIVLAMTAMRSQELDLLERYPKINKSEHSDLDESFNLTRIVYKTASCAKGKHLTMPIPEIAAKALDNLSVLSEINDGHKKGILNLSSITQSKDDNAQGRITDAIRSFCKKIDIDNPPSPHQFRHTMSFLVAHLNDKDGMELAMLMLGHSSIEMTKRYMGHFNELVKKALKYMGESNPLISDALLDLQHNESFDILENVIIPNIEQNHPMVGPIAKRITQFTGNITDDMKKLFRKTMHIMIETGKLAIIQTPTNLCLHDLTDPNKMACQRGISKESFIGAPIFPTACEGPSCGYSLFTVQNVEALREQSKLLLSQYPEELRERLSKNTYYVDDGLQNQYVNIIKEYDEQVKSREEK